jgi:transcriptional regulator NrdR family protein
MVYVVKRDGRKQKFSLAKARGSVKKALLDAGLPANYKAVALEKIVSSIARDAKIHGEIPASHVRSRLLGGLEKNAKAAAKAWRKFDAKYK